MSRAGYLMVAVLVGCLATIFYVEQDSIDLRSFCNALFQSGKHILGEKSLQRRSDDQNIGQGGNDCKSSSTRVSNEVRSQNEKELKSKQSPTDNTCFEQDSSAPSTKTKEQHVEKEDGHGDCEEKKAKKEHGTHWGHMKQLGQHGSVIMEGDIEELNFVPNGKDFYEQFLRKRRPLVMRGAMKNWPAVKHWANESYLQEKYGDVIFDVQLTKKYEGEFPVKKTMNLNEFLDIYKTRQVYLDCPFPHSHMIQDIFVPYCLQCEETMKTIESTHLLFSSGNTSSSCHMDGYENLLSLIAGTKEILVADPKYVEYFYPRNHTTVNIESPIDPEAVDLKKFPKLAEVPFHKVGYSC